MEAFQLLSRGGIKFDKRRFRKDFKLFDVRCLCACFCFAIEASSPKTSKSKDEESADAHGLTDGGELPADLDFFKYAQASVKTKGKSPQKRAEGEDDDVDGQPEKKRAKLGEEDETPKQPRHRVTAKGANVPKCVESFDALRDRYNVAPRLLANLSQSGYTTPTAIQSYGVPILLEVCRVGLRQLVLLTAPSRDEIWRLFRRPALERHYPTSFPSWPPLAVLYLSLRRNPGRASVPSLWHRHANLRIKSTTSA